MLSIRLACTCLLTPSYARAPEEMGRRLNHQLRTVSKVSSTPSVLITGTSDNVFFYILLRVAKPCRCKLAQMLCPRNNISPMLHKALNCLVYIRQGTGIRMPDRCIANSVPSSQEIANADDGCQQKGVSCGPARNMYRATRARATKPPWSL